MKPIQSQQGMALIEALVAVLILGIGLLGTIGMQARAYQGLSDAGTRAEATMAAEKLAGIMSTDLASLPNYAKTASGAAPAALQNWYAETTDHIPGAVVAVDVVPLFTVSTEVTIAIAWKRQGIRNPGAVTCTTSGALPPECNRHVVTTYIARAK